MELVIIILSAVVLTHARIPSLANVCKEEGALLPARVCNLFHKCSNGVPVEQMCPEGLLYNIKIQQCDWPQNVDCEGRIELADINQPEHKDEDINKPILIEQGRCAGPNSEGKLLPARECYHFYKCANGVPVAQICPIGLLYNIHKQQCDWPHNVDCRGRIEAVDISVPEDKDQDINKPDLIGEGRCAGSNYDGKLLPARECYQFYKCSNGIPVSQRCPIGLVYNIEIQQCDWPHNVDCRGRIEAVDISEPEDKDEPILIGEVRCVGPNSDGKLFPARECYHFHKCANGVPVTQICPVGLHYNILTQQCDWPHNVDCTGRIVV